VVVQAIPKVCPYFKRRADRNHILRGICSIKHKRVAALIDTYDTYGDEDIAVHRWCQIADLVGEGYLHCQIFSKYFWTVLQEKAASEIAKSTEKSEQRSEVER